jgi:hypothetical protein
MTYVETVRRDARSYRQGLVLGLTMAEVFLLLVFALLIALATLWISEEQKRKALEDQQKHSPIEDAVDRQKGLNVKLSINKSHKFMVERREHRVEPHHGPIARLARRTVWAAHF